jgi:OmpA-OmpF porin, OOP family
LLGKIFGENTSSVAEVLASSSGIRTSSASSLLSMMVPLVLGVVGKHATSQGFNASGVADLLLSQKQSIFGALPVGMSQLVGLNGPRVVPTNANSSVDDTRSVAGERPRPSPYIRPTVSAEPSMKKWLWVALIALVGLLFWYFARGRGPSETMTRVSLPNGTSISVPDGSLNYNLASYLASGSQDVPRTFVFDHLNFQSSSADVTPDSVQTVHDLTEIMKAYPNVQFQLVGHTDNTGDADTNQKLSVDRANTVRAMLVSGGVNPQRISTTGYGQLRPIAINDTEEGRAKNRRIELTVTSK